MTKAKWIQWFFAFVPRPQWFLTADLFLMNLGWGISESLHVLLRISYAISAAKNSLRSSLWQKAVKHSWGYAFHAKTSNHLFRCLRGHRTHTHFCHSIHKADMDTTFLAFPPRPQGFLTADRCVYDIEIVRKACQTLLGIRMQSLRNSYIYNTRSTHFSLSYIRHRGGSGTKWNVSL